MRTTSRRPPACCDEGQANPLSLVGRMGTTLIRACCETLSQAGTAQQRAEDLSLEVYEARQENQRLNRQLQRMRHALKEGEDVEVKPPPEDDRLNDKAQQLNRMLKQLQSENANLRRSGPKAPEHRGQSVSLSQYQTLQQQVKDLQRQVIHQQAGYVPASGSLPSSYTRGGSRLASGRETPMSGLASPQRWSQMPSGAPSDVSSVEDFRRRMYAMQQENDMLKKKVRMLASN
mmetsp:Transcript_42258/g.94595  ORF Transcript_42258/g.94595 Transcript_42258/m.94595 type:complete len:232 (+) Transcript_42258:53-748(+)